MAPFSKKPPHCTRALPLAPLAECLPLRHYGHTQLHSQAAAFLINTGTSVDRDSFWDCVTEQTEPPVALCFRLAYSCPWLGLGGFMVLGWVLLRAQTHMKLRSTQSWFVYLFRHVFENVLSSLFIDMFCYLQFSMNWEGQNRKLSVKDCRNVEAHMKPSWMNHRLICKYSLSHLP